MTFDLPNFGDSGVAPEQARFFATDAVILSQAASLTGVKNGCAVTAQGSPNMTVAVASGVVYWLNSEVTVTAGNVTIATANATNPRLDLIVVNSSGVKSAVAGTAAVIPRPPALPALSVALAQVLVPALDTTIGATQIKDRRIIVQVPSVAGASTVVRKTADESVASSTVLQDDNHLFFAMTSNGRWEFKIEIQTVSLAVANTMSFNLSAPSGAVWRYLASLPAANPVSRSSDGGSSDVSTGAIAQSGADIIVIEGIVTTVATSGNLQFRWAQGSSNATPLKVLTNSYLEYRPL